MRAYASAQIFLAVSTTSCSFCHCSSSVNRLPSSDDAKPHCGLMARLSSGTYRLASSIRRRSVSCGSSCGHFAADQAENDTLVAGNETERLESAGAVGLVFQEKEIHVELVEQLFSDRIVTALRVPLASIVSATEVDGQRHPLSSRSIEARIVDADRFVERVVGGDVHFPSDVVTPFRIEVVAIPRRVDLHVVDALVHQRTESQT